ncbi:fructoselysine 6-kinase [Neobacillus sp. PS3-12]|uniref:fructoselysine 6-kinase n=1 Tax=Neobacillus sp. PS3-12 TaxID=3070677 RepID=UPI0027DF404D|nr:fructoselysine 6-kinase [Neobacillus sp. PS3-12]WML55228.1 fructoselysine 6-kinase [Neobacillus sp. PS3-12]
MVKVLGLGDNVVDKYEHIHTMYPGGNALNFAVYAKRLGVEAAYLGVFGSDEAAAHVIDSIEKIGLDISHCKHYEGENGAARVTLKDGDRVFLGSNKGGVLREFGLNLTAADLEYINRFDVVHAGLYGYTESELAKIEAPISFDFSSDFTGEKINQVAPLVNYAFFSCSHMTQDEVRDLMIKVSVLGPELVLCTLGEDGALLFDGKEFYAQKPKLVKAIDTMGAGDSFITCFLVNYIDGTKDIKTCLEIAADFAAKQVLVEGSFGFGKRYV